MDAWGFSAATWALAATAASLLASALWLSALFRLLVSGGCAGGVGRLTGCRHRVRGAGEGGLLARGATVSVSLRLRRVPVFLV